jgi:hypothetical protein
MKTLHGEEPLSVLWCRWSLSQGLPQGRYYQGLRCTASCIFLLTACFGSFGPEKIVRDPHDAQIGSCVNSNCAIPLAHLNAAAFNDLDSLISLLTLPSIPSSAPAPALIDSGSSHCFIDLSFVAQLNVATQNISLLRLRLLDGSDANIISRSVEIPVVFPCGEHFTLEFLVTPLDPNCPLVLGH